MYIDKLKINSFRNLEDTTLSFSKELNFIIGDNGSGKSSLLESIYLLGRSRSFRTNNLDNAIRRDERSFTSFGESLSARGIVSRVGIQKKFKAPIDRRINGDPVGSLIQLAENVPLQLLDPSSFELVNGGPKQRRAFVDWGVFHVEQSFGQAWKEWRRAYQQRNKYLKGGRLTGPETNIWDESFIRNSEEITKLRKSYFKQYTQRFIKILECPIFKGLEAELLTLSFKKGWREDENLDSILNLNFENDVRLGYTRVGPQKADMEIRYRGVDAKDSLSRGQQKILIAALKVAQIEFMKELVGKSCVMLIDDLGAELDIEKQEMLLKLFLEQGAQVIATTLDELVVERMTSNKNLHWEIKMFHVEQGRLREVLPFDSGDRSPI